MKTVKALIFRFYSSISPSLPFAPWTPPPASLFYTPRTCEHVFLDVSVCFSEDVSVCHPHWQLKSLHHPFSRLGYIIKEFSASFLAFQLRQTDFTRTKATKFLLPNYLTQLLYTSNYSHLLFYISFLISFEVCEETVISYKPLDATVAIQRGYPHQNQT